MTNTFWAFIVLCIVGTLLIISGSKKQKEEGKDWPMPIQLGYLGVVIGGFGALSSFMSYSTIMLVIVLVSALGYFSERFYFAKKREIGTQRNHFLDYSSGFFPIILVVFVLRSFVVEPFQIPSSSMRPGLVVGDFILVNKFTYGLRLPVANNVIIPVSQVHHGDVVVFNFPDNTKVDYIKRAIGLPGDVVEYRNKRLTVNGQVVKDVPDGFYKYQEQGQVIDNAQFKESLGTHHYKVLNIPDFPVYQPQLVEDFPYRENCRYDEDGFVCKVPAGHYFMMGDNRDNSLDSRYWGFVPDRLLVGKAFMVWMNFKDLSRIGTFF